LPAFDHGPVRPVPFGQAARGNVGTRPGFGAILAVVGRDHPSLGGVKSFAVVTGEEFPGDVHRPHGVAVFVERGHFERRHVHLVETLLHRGEIDLAGGVGEVTCGAG